MVLILPSWLGGKLVLTEQQCKRAAARDRVYRLTDERGLCLVVSPAGGKSWQYRYRFEGKGQTLTLGKYPALSLLQARNRHAALVLEVERGVNPAAKKDQPAPELPLLFEALADEWLAAHGVRLAPRTLEITRGVLVNHINPVIGQMPVAAIRPAHVLQVLKNLEAAGKLTTAIKARQVVSSVMRFGVVSLRCETDPAAPLDGYIKRGPVVHARALSESELRDLLSALARYQGQSVARELVLFQMLTFVRSIEARGALWSDIDFDAALWKIPAERMKMRREHWVPLSPVALRLLRSVRELSAKWDHVFPGADKRRPMGGSTINAVLRYATGNGYGQITSHDFRATASTWLHERQFDHAAIELQLAHAQQSKTVASYNHAQLLDARRELVTAYDGWLESLCPAAFESRFVLDSHSSISD